MKKYFILMIILVISGICVVWADSSLGTISIKEKTDVQEESTPSENLDSDSKTNQEEVETIQVTSYSKSVEVSQEDQNSNSDDSSKEITESTPATEKTENVSEQTEEVKTEVEVIEIDSNFYTSSKETTTDSLESVTTSSDEKNTTIEISEVSDTTEETTILEVESSTTETTTIQESSTENTTEKATTSIESTIQEESTVTEDKTEEVTNTSAVTEDKTVYSSSKIKLSKEIKYLKYKNTYQLKATLKGIEGTIVWSTSNANIAKVDQNGKVTATGGGLAVITATVGNEKTSCQIIAIRNSFQKLNKNPYRTTATIYYNGNEKITYYFRTQSYNTACSSEKVNGKQICTSGFRTWYANHGCGTTATTAVVNAYLGNDKSNLISEAKMRMYYEKKEYNWSCSSSDPYCNQTIFQLTRKRVANVLKNQFGLSATAYVIKAKTGNEEHIKRITTALAEGRPVIIFINAGQAGTTKFTSQNHTLVMVGFADEEGHVLILDSSHDGFREDTVSKMVNQYIGRGSGNYRGYIVSNQTKS